MRPSVINATGGKHALSLVEVVISIAIIGILASIAILSLSYVVDASKQSVGRDTLEYMNRAVLHYSQAHAQIGIAADLGTEDEFGVIALLQSRDTKLPGSPYLSPEMQFQSSSSTEEIRFYWNGKFFRMYLKGTAGTGVSLD